MSVPMTGHSCRSPNGSDFGAGLKLPLRAPCLLLLAGTLAAAQAQTPSADAPAATAGPAATRGAAGDANGQEAVAAATAATDRWLAMLDAGKFGESWNSAAEVFRLAVTEAEWAVDLDGMRTRLGKATMREVKAAKFSTTLRGATLTGEYVTISYLTKFANAPIAMETLVVSKESDGEWRIAGYNIGKAPDQ
jgi:hypothetical protein